MLEVTIDKDATVAASASITVTHAGAEEEAKETEEDGIIIMGLGKEEAKKEKTTDSAWLLPSAVRVSFSNGTVCHPEAKIVLQIPSIKKEEAPSEESLPFWATTSGDSPAEMSLKIGPHNLFEERCQVILDLSRWSPLWQTEAPTEPLLIVGEANRFESGCIVRVRGRSKEGMGMCLGNANVFEPSSDVGYTGRIGNGNVFVAGVVSSETDENTDENVVLNDTVVYSYHDGITGTRYDPSPLATKSDSLVLRMRPGQANAAENAQETKDLNKAAVVILKRHHKLMEGTASID